MTRRRRSPSGGRSCRCRRRRRSRTRCPSLPDVPVTYLADLKARVEQPSLAPEEQWRLLTELEERLTRPEEADAARTLLSQFADRPDLMQGVAATAARVLDSGAAATTAKTLADVPQPVATTPNQVDRPRCRRRRRPRRRRRRRGRRPRRWWRRRADTRHVLRPQPQRRRRHGPRQRLRGVARGRRRRRSSGSSPPPPRRWLPWSTRRSRRSDRRPRTSTRCTHARPRFLPITTGRSPAQRSRCSPSSATPGSSPPTPSSASSSTSSARSTGPRSVGSRTSRPRPRVSASPSPPSSASPRPPTRPSARQTSSPPRSTATGCSPCTASLCITTQAEDRLLAAATDECVETERLAPGFAAVNFDLPGVSEEQQLCLGEAVLDTIGLEVWAATTVGSPEVIEQLTTAAEGCDVDPRSVLPLHRGVTRYGLANSSSSEPGRTTGRSPAGSASSSAKAA